MSFCVQRISVPLSKAGTYQVTYQMVGHFISKRLQEGSEWVQEAPRGPRWNQAPRGSQKFREALSISHTVRQNPLLGLAELRK